MYFVNNKCTRIVPVPVERGRSIYALGLEEEENIHAYLLGIC